MCFTCKMHTQLKYTVFTLFISAFLGQNLNAQKGILTFGLQYKPMLPVEFINAGDDVQTEGGITYTNTQNYGYVGGGIIRYGITDYLALETGITFVQRNYTLNIDSLDNEFEADLDYRMIGYQIPVTAMVFIQLDRELFMSASLGGSLDIFPSDVFSSEDRSDDTDFGRSSFIHETVRYRWLQASVMANLGFEYRVRDIGTFYLGGSFHLPFSPIYKSKIGYEDVLQPLNTLDLRGTYLTLDLRYYFPDKSKAGK